ncbi:MAG: LacI family transcriptional regulator [Oscillospiraceae bacterium]|nr:LacI family transcriptional regulator [Oscillospiraceae bacterium]
MTTLKDIAREAEVSITTVSNVVHGRQSRVSPEVSTKILEIIERENYIPSMTARTLANNASPIVGIINHAHSQSGGGFLSDPFHNTFIGSIEDRMRDEGYYIMVRTVKDARGLEEVYRNWNLAGMVFTGLYEDDFFECVRRINIPYVLIDSYISSADACNVGLEDQKGGYIATRYLLENGHRVIAFASPIIRKDGVVEQRLHGYRQALQEFGVPFDRELVFEKEIYNTAEGIKLGRFIGTKKDVTGIFATADVLAAGIITGLREIGINVPADKSIIGFDDNYLCQITYPHLTTVHQDAEQKGIIAAEMMLAQLKNKPIRERKIILPVFLQIRDSVRKL